MPSRILAGTDPRVVAFMANHHGLITAEQARDLGVSTPYMRAMVAARRWLPLRRGVYVDAEVWAALDPWRGRPLLLARATTLAMRRAWVLSHDSAAHALDLDVLLDPDADPTPPAVHVTRPGDTTAWTANGIGHHLARFPADGVVEVDGLRMLEPARTVVDMARYHGLRSGLVTAASALRTGATTKAAMWNVVDGMASWPYVTVVRSMIELADGRAQSAVEALALEFLLELGIGEPDPQWPLQRSDGRVAWCDVRVGRHVFEVHGKVKVLAPEEGGVAEAPAAEVLWDQRKRERLVVGEGLGLSNLYREDFFGSARKRAAARIRAEYRAAVERLGTDLPPHLAAAAAEIRARAAGRPHAG